MLTKKIVKKGTSNYVLLSNDFLKSLGLKTGDEVKTILKDNQIVIEPIKLEKE